MISFNIIREDTIPIVSKVDSFEFAGGESRTLAIQVINKYDKLPYLIADASTIEITLQTTDSQSPVVKAATLNAINKSIISVDLTISETESIIQGRMSIKITNGTDVKIGVRDNIMSKIRL